MDNCRLCGSSQMVELLDFGSHPIAHWYSTSLSAKEYVHPVVLTFCELCGQMQIDDPISPEVLYKNYICFSSWKFQPHIPHIVDLIDKFFSLKKDALILEVGSNDGRFLEILKESGYKNVVGIEPTQDASALSQEKGLDTIHGFFNRPLAKEFVSKRGKCDALISRQVLEHIKDLQEFGDALQLVLAPGAYILIEVPNFMANLENLDYTIWEEHVNYFTLDTLKYFLSKAGVKVIHHETFVFSGDNVVILGQYSGKPLPVSSSNYLAILRKKAFKYKDAWPKFKESMRAYLAEQKKKFGKIAFYGAGARSCSFINFLGLKSHIDYILDDQLEKQNKYLPGSGLVISPGSILEEQNIRFCMLGVNSECEDKLISKHPEFVRKGGEFISVLPPSHRVPDLWRQMQGK